MKKKLSNRVSDISTRWKLGDFFRNFTAVVLGIVITFVGSSIIEGYNTRKEVKKALQLVKSELLINREEVKNMVQRLTLEQQGAEYLLEFKGRMHEASRDSLNKYASLPFQWSQFSFIFDAMEMLKVSALIQKIENKELSLQIIKAYDAVKTADRSFQSFSGIKKRLLDNLSTNPEVKRISTDFADVDVIDVWSFYFKFPEGVALVQQIPRIQGTQIYYQSIEQINQTIAALDKEYK